jgi:hypothetical protein
MVLINSGAGVPPELFAPTVIYDTVQRFLQPVFVVEVFVVRIGHTEGLVVVCRSVDGIDGHVIDVARGDTRAAIQTPGFVVFLEQGDPLYRICSQGFQVTEN